MKKRLLIILFPALWISQTLSAQPAASYYKPADGLSGKALKTALWNIIKNPDVDSYNTLWTDYMYTDVNAEGYIWDMYSSTTKYTSTDQKQQSYEGSGLNREHSMPKSWFNSSNVEQETMYSDIVHVIPTDGWVNNMRSNYPYGETNGTKKSANGFSKLGNSTVSGYGKTVFEPNDLYKGDLARIYFYMATCYEDKVADWVCDMFSGDSYTAYSDWALPMLLRWAKQDPVSKKELDRNNRVYTIQLNRNPFVDYPGLEQYVWGDLTGEPFSYDNYAIPLGYEGDSGRTDIYEILLHAPFASSLDNFTIQNVEKGSLKNVWTTTADYGMKASAFVGSTAIAAEAWLISPFVDLSDCESATLTFKHTGKFFGDKTTEATCWARPEGGTWQQVEIPNYFSNQNWTFVRAIVDVSAFVGQKVQFGFCYKSTTANAGTWEIKNLSLGAVRQSSPSGVGRVVANPSQHDGAVYNLAGQRVDVPTKGIYIRNGRKFVVR